MKQNDVVLVAVYVRNRGGGGRQMTSTNLQCANQNYEYLYSVV